MNPAFFQQIETILATERLDAYRQDELRNLAVALDRFTTIRQQGLKPWLEKIQQRWPKP